MRSIVYNFAPDEEGLIEVHKGGELYSKTIIGKTGKGKMLFYQHPLPEDIPDGPYYLHSSLEKEIKEEDEDEEEDE